MSYDNLAKLLVEKYPQRFASWVLGETPDFIQVLKTELSIEPIRADAVTLLSTSGRILHLEFQTRWYSDPPMPLRLLDYWVRLYRLYRQPITQVVILLLPPSSDTPIESEFAHENTLHRYQVIKMWEQDPTPLLEDIALLPLAALAHSQEPATLLQQVAQRVNMIGEAQQRQETAAYTEIMAGLKYDKAVIQRLFQEGMMRESVIYQEILQEGVQQGMQQGIQKGMQQGESGVILRQLGRKLGLLSPEVIQLISALSVERLDALAESLLSFSSLDDLLRWLDENT